MDYRKIIKNMPKVQLHCHIDGSVRPSTLLELSKKRGIKLPTEDLKELKKYVAVEDKCSSLKDYLKKFSYPLSVMQDKENIYRITLELIEDCSKENIKYIELRFAPYLHLEEGLSIKDVLEAVIDAKNEGEKRFGVKSNIICSFMRHETNEKNFNQLKEVAKFINKGVVAVDLAGNEADFPPKLFKELFKEAKKLGFHVTIHAGETGNEKNIIDSINLLGAERIGHGVSAYKDSSVEEFLIKNNIPLEICITSNYNTEIVDKIKNHPVRRFFDKGLNVTLNTDNNTVSNVDLTEEYIKLYEELNFSLDEIKQININTVNSSFCDDKTKSSIINSIKEIK